MQGPAQRIHLIESSLRCFLYGTLSLIPLLGLGFAVLALRLHFRTWAETADGWNPAGRYLRAGFCLAWIGALISVSALALFVVVLMNEYGF
jgi:hypothetical protein